MDWTNSIPQSKEDIRASLDLRTVIYEELGVTIDAENQGICPFHDDTRPSFAVFESEDGVERAGCWACGWRGDVFDIIRAARSCSFKESVEIAKGYIGQQIKARRIKTTTFRDFSEEYRRSLEAYALDPAPVVNFIRAKGYAWDAEWLNANWGIGVAASLGQGSIMIPHFDELMRCVGFKHRTAYTPPISASGSRFPCLYGMWRDNGSLPVVLTEGESDTWAVSWFVPEVIALGLPTGAGTPLRSEWLQYLSGRDVTVCFDGDDPGRSAAARWAAALPVRVVELSEGDDCVALGSNIRTAILVG